MIITGPLTPHEDQSKWERRYWALGRTYEAERKKLKARLLWLLPVAALAGSVVTTLMLGV